MHGLAPAPSGAQGQGRLRSVLMIERQLPNSQSRKTVFLRDTQIYTHIYLSLYTYTHIHMTYVLKDCFSETILQGSSRILNLERQLPDFQHRKTTSIKSKNSPEETPTPRRDSEKQCVLLSLMCIIALFSRSLFRGI